MAWIHPSYRNELRLARSHAYRYTDHGIDWDYAGRSASIRRLDLSGPIASGGDAAQSDDGAANRATARSP